MNKKNNYIWLFGENLGNTANNNSFYFWKHIINKKNKEGINKYFIMNKNKKNIQIYKKMTAKEKKAIIWKNSIKHYLLFKNADMYYVTLSYRDILPEGKIWSKYNLKIEKPIIYLQHGTLLMKKIGYSGNSYNNNLFRFIYYNKQIKNALIEENDFRKYQLLYGKFHPRYKKLAQMYLKDKNNEQNQIFWFFTWREYFGKNIQTELFVRKIRNIIKDERLNNYLKSNNLKIKICMHQFFDGKIGNIIKQYNIDNIEICFQDKIDIMQEIVKSKVLITDYSSLSFDFTILGKPVILFQPDLEEYLKKREFYCDIDEMKHYNIENSSELIDSIVNQKYEVNQFIRARCPKKIDLKQISKGKFIDELYNYFVEKQKNKIVFLGYNFYGAGGTVSATKALAEGLLEEDNIVELISLKKSYKARNFPYALSNNFFYDSNTREFKEKIKFKLFSKKFYSYLKNDPSREWLEPYSGYKLKKVLKKIRANTVVSTRESLHLFLLNAESKKIKNKIYFFHCPAHFLENLFPNTMKEFRTKKLSKVVFVTEKNKEEIEELYDYQNYDSYWVSGNTLERRNCINIKRIQPVEKKEVYHAIYLLRINKERIDDINNMVNFAIYLRQNNVKNLIIDVFGDGDYVEQFLDLLEENQIMDIIHYKGKTADSPYHIRRHDFMIDFSLNQSFGMTYIEGVMNGKMVFCMKNAGSIEVMKDIQDCYIESYEDLVNKISNIDRIANEERLKENYNKIWERYSRNKMAKNFINFIEGK